MNFRHLLGCDTIGNNKTRQQQHHNGAEINSNHLC